jgi:Raf kinase inhibitor-like YbhB/YbcL family protein
MEVRMRRKMFFIALVLAVGLAGCAKATPLPTKVPELAPTATVQPAEVPPSVTSAPTATSAPTVAAAPTATPLESTSTPEPTEVVMPFEITSEAFDHEAAIPEKYTCDGDDISPPLAWTDPPDGTQSLALISDDPDAPGGTWVHWVVYNLPADARGLPEAIAGDGDLPGGVHGMNSWPRAEYGGPCPPSGTHRYFFTLYAVDTTLALEPGASKADVIGALEGHVLAEKTLMGTYQR